MHCYIHGSYVEAENASVSVFDPGFVRGEAIFDVWRTYGGRLVRGVFDRHLARLEQGIRFLGIEPADVIAEIDKATAVLAEMNSDQIGDVGDLRFWCCVTPGSKFEGQRRIPTVVIAVTGIDFASFFKQNLYDTGAQLVPSLVVQSPWGAVDPRIKNTSRLSMLHAEAKRFDEPGGRWGLLYDADGYITEAGGASLALIKDGAVVRAPRETVLGGISLALFCEFARDLGVTTREQYLSAFDFLNADEVWLMSSSIAAVPVFSIDGLRLQQRTSIGEAILQKWIEYVDFDFREQAIARSGNGRVE